MPVQIDIRLHCKMCQCTVYAILTVRLLHYHHIALILLVNRHEISVHSVITDLIRNSGHFGPPLPFWAHGPSALPGLPMASYATASSPKPVLRRRPKTKVLIEGWRRCFGSELDVDGPATANAPTTISINQSINNRLIDKMT